MKRSLQSIHASAVINVKKYEEIICSKKEKQPVWLLSILYLAIKYMPISNATSSQDLKKMKSSSQ